MARVMQKGLKNGRFWEGSSDQPTRWLIRLHVKETGTSKLTLRNSFHSHEYGKN